MREDVRTYLLSMRIIELKWSLMEPLLSGVNLQAKGAGWVAMGIALTG